jgi:DNA (cytosine-5)-methyltransferase 1
MNELALFAGAGGGILGGHLLGWRTVCAVEWEPYPASVLCARQNDGFLPPFPIWDDIQTFDGRPWRGIVDVISGGFPCQDISAAGKGAGIDGERSGMWREMARVVSEVRPRFAYVENSPVLTSRGIDKVLWDLASMGFDARWGVLSAAEVGAPHKRDRIWILAHAQRDGSQGVRQDGATQGSVGLRSRERSNQEQDLQVAHAEDKRNVRGNGELGVTQEEHDHRRGKEDGGGQWWATEPNVGRVVDGVACRVDRLKAIGNGQVPEVARRAWEVLNAD